MDWAALLALLPTVALVAVILTILVVLVSVWQNRHEETDWVETPLRAEIDHNLQLLKDCWARLGPREASEDEVHSLQKRHYALEFARSPFPTFSREAFNRHLDDLTRSRRRYGKVVKLYADLDRLEEIRHELRVALAPGVGPSGAYDEFLRVAGRSWDEAWHLIERLLEQGNPLGK